MLSVEGRRPRDSDGPRPAPAASGRSAATRPSEAPPLRRSTRRRRACAAAPARSRRTARSPPTRPARPAPSRRARRAAGDGVVTHASVERRLAGTATITAEPTRRHGRTSEQRAPRAPASAIARTRPGSSTVDHAATSATIGGSSGDALYARSSRAPGRGEDATARSSPQAERTATGTPCAASRRSAGSAAMRRRPGVRRSVHGHDRGGAAEEQRVGRRGTRDARGDERRASRHAARHRRDRSRAPRCMTPATAEAPASASSASSQRASARSARLERGGRRRRAQPDAASRAGLRVHERDAAARTASSRLFAPGGPATPRAVEVEEDYGIVARRLLHLAHHQAAAPCRRGPVHCPQRLAVAVLADAVRLRAAGEGERPPADRPASAPAPVDERRGRAARSAVEPGAAARPGTGSSTCASPSGSFDGQHSRAGAVHPTRQRRHHDRRRRPGARCGPAGADDRADRVAERDAARASVARRARRLR